MKAKKFFTILTALLFLGIGNAWGAESATNDPATVTYGTGSAEKTFLDVSNTVSNTTIATGSVACVTYGLYEMDKNWKPAFYAGPSNGSSSSYNFANAADYGFMAGSSAGTGTAANKSATSGYGAAKYTSAAEAVLYVTGITGIAVMGKDNNTSGEKRLYIKVETYAADGTCTAVGSGDGITKSDPYNKNLHITEFAAGTLSGTAYYKITLTSGNTSNCETSQIRFTKYIAPSCTAPTGVGVTGAGEYTVGDAITLTGSATDNTDASTTYTWYKGSTWDAASATTPVQTASTSGNTLTIDPCALGDAGTYWCSIANSTCEAHASAAVTVIPAGGTTHSISYANLRGSDVSAYPTEFYEGVGVASFADLADVGDWHFAGWSPSSIGTDVTTDQTITALWTRTIEQVLYSWEGAEGGATEVGGTAEGSTDGLLNQPSAGYYCLKIDGKADWSTTHVDITLSGEEKVKTGDKIKYWGFYYKDQSKSARPKMRDGNSPNNEIFNDGTNLPNLYDGTGSPAERTFTVPASINTNKVQITRSQTGSNTWIPKLQIIREKEVAEENICTITFNSDGGSTVADVIVEKGTKATRPADPTKSGATFAGWYNGADLYDWDANVTGDLALTAHWNVSHTVTYKDGTTTLGTETVIDGNNPIEYATYEAKAHYSFNGWFNNSDLDPSHAVTIASEVITDDAIYFGKWTENAKVTVAFRVDGVDYSSSEVYVGEKATSPDSPSKAGKIFRGWFNGADKFDFTANVTAAVTLDASWDDAAPNHFQYAYNDDFHFDGVTYKTPEGKVDVGAGASNVAITTPYTLFSGAEGITSIVATKAIYDSKSNWVNAYLKLAKDDATSNLAFTIATGYTAVLTMKMGGYSNNPTVTLNDGSADVEPTSGTIGGKASTENNFNEIVYDLAAGTYTLTSASQTLYISHIDLVATPAVVPPTPETVRTGLEVGRYYTICLPKKVVAATGATFWSMSERNTDTENPLAYIVEENLPLTAGQPFLFQATATTLEVTYEGEATTAGSHGALHGTLDAMDQDALDAAAGANTLYILKNNELRLASGRTGNSLPANRAYVIYEELDPVSTPSHAPGRQVRSMPLHRDVATGLDDLNVDNQAQKVLLNGQLFIIRGEKMYDATGILVK